MDLFKRYYLILMCTNQPNSKLPSVGWVWGGQYANLLTFKFGYFWINNNISQNTSVYMYKVWYLYFYKKHFAGMNGVKISFFFKIIASIILTIKFVSYALMHQRPLVGTGWHSKRSTYSIIFRNAWNIMDFIVVTSG